MNKFKHEGCCICGADRQMFQLKCSNTGQTLHICWDCAKDIAEQHFSESGKTFARWIKGKHWDEWFCSACHNAANLDWKENPILSDFCPHCGARMKDGELASYALDEDLQEETKWTKENPALTPFIKRRFMKRR